MVDMLDSKSSACIKRESSSLSIRTSNDIYFVSIVYIFIGIIESIFFYCLLL
jgi:hypothetical protein